MAPKPKSPHLYLIEDRGFDTPCWVWQRAANSAGYGVVRTGPGAKTVALAHRKFWEDENGPVPAGLILDHLCCVELCVRPSHLEPVTQAENCRRGRSSTLTTTTAAEIRERLRLGGHEPEIAAAFGINAATVRDIATGRRWAGV